MGGLFCRQTDDVSALQNQGWKPQCSPVAFRSKDREGNPGATLQELENFQSTAAAAVGDDMCPCIQSWVLRDKGSYCFVIGLWLTPPLSCTVHKT